MMTTNPLIGLRFGRLIALEETRVGHNHRAMVCQCDCGRKKTIRLSHLKAGRIKSCGCLMRETIDAHKRRTMAARLAKELPT